MKELFLKLVEMSLSAGWLVLAVVGLRLILRRMPKNLFCLLWGLVGLRLLCPFSLESAFSLIPRGGTVTHHTPRFDVTQVETGVSFVDETVKTVIGEQSPVLGGSRFDLTQVGMVVWLVGIALFLLYGVVSYLRLRGRVAEALPMGEGVYRCETVDGPFVLGIFRPRIYVPARMDEETFHYAILHERTHLRRLDHLVKPLAFVLLAVYWFHPLLWVAYALLCRDMEAACDQRVLRDMDDKGRRGYASALLACGVDRKSLAACPVAFGEINVKNRIKGVLSYKKPTLWILVVAVVLCGVVAVCFLTNREIHGEEGAQGNLTSSASGQGAGETSGQEGLATKYIYVTSVSEDGFEGGSYLYLDPYNNITVEDVRFYRYPDADSLFKVNDTVKTVYDPLQVKEKKDGSQWVTALFARLSDPEQGEKVYKKIPKYKYGVVTGVNEEGILIDETFYECPGLTSMPCKRDEVRIAYDEENVREEVGTVILDGEEHAYTKRVANAAWDPDYQGFMVYKPVIYLYPEEETACSVELVLEGELTCTYPAYGEEGWQRFTAHPDGTLIFEDGGEYYCLYWEGELPPTADFSTGFCVKGSDTAAFLNEALLAQGLTPREANEFIIYWLPLMEDNPYNLISFDTAAYTKSAQLQVEPAPDTVIRVFMTWQAAEEYVAMTPQTFTTPQRNGFTLVEWGGSKVE